MKQDVAPPVVSFTPRAVAEAAPSAAFLAEIAGAAVNGYVVEVTPPLAAQWLRANHGNRLVRPAHVNNLAEEITTQRWRVTHQGIAFSSSGRLIDGQHRLNAIIAADKPAWVTVFIDLDDDMFGALDRGMRRSVADELRQPQRMVEICTWIGRLFNRSHGHPPSPADTADLLDLYREQIEAVQAAVPGTSRRTSAGVRAALTLRLRDASRAQRMFLLAQYKAYALLDTAAMDVTTGAMLRRLESCTGGTSSAGEERGAVAWNAFHPGSRDLKKIVIRDLTTEINEMKSAVERHQRERAEARDGKARLERVHTPDRRQGLFS